MKKLFGMFFTILCLFCLTLPASAAKGYVDYVVDSANIIDDETEDKLSDRLRSLSSDNNMDIVILTVDYLNGKTAEAYADDYYDYNGYSKDGILFLISMEHRDWAISTTGKGISVFTDQRCDDIFEHMMSALAVNDFDSAFVEFADSCESTFEQNNYYHRIKRMIIIFSSAVAGLIVAAIVTIKLSLELKSVGSKKNANNYLLQYTVHLNDS